MTAPCAIEYILVTRWRGGKKGGQNRVFFFFFLALCCLGKIPGGAPFSQLHKSGIGSRVEGPKLAMDKDELNNKIAAATNSYTGGDGKGRTEMGCVRVTQGTEVFFFCCIAERAIKPCRSSRSKLRGEFGIPRHLQNRNQKHKNKATRQTTTQNKQRQEPASVGM